MFCNKCGTTSPEGQQFCKKCGSPFATHHDADAIIGVGQPELLFSVSPLRLLLLTILSMGFYRIFWFYKNWAAVQKIQKLDISPLSRALFSIFYCHELFSKIINLARERGYTKRRSPLLFSSAFIVLSLASIALGRYESTDIKVEIYWLVLSNSVIIPLLFIQDAINFYNTTINPSKVRHIGFSKGEILVTISGFIIFSMYILNIVLYGIAPSASLEVSRVQMPPESPEQAETVVQPPLVPTPEWYEFFAPGGEFKVSVPAKPEEVVPSGVTQDVDKDTKSDEGYRSTSADGIQYYILTTALPFDSSQFDQDILLAQALAGVVESTEASQLISSSPTNFAGKRAVNFLIRQGDEYFKGKLILTNRTLYQVVVRYDQSRVVETEYEKFMSSFSFL